MPLIEAHGLTKVFRRPDKGPGLRGSLQHLVTRRFTETTAVDSIDLEIGEGEAVAYVGPNGAGKSTTVKLLSGILVPTSGEVRVGGIVPHRDRVANARQIGVLFGQRTQLWWDLPVRESLALLRDMFGVPARVYEQRLERFDHVLGLGELLPVVARKLSLGQRMRADLAAALLHSPRIVYLDEPTIGLDISVKDRVRGFLKELVADGVTLILTTHDLGDIEDVCRRLAIIDQGKIIYDGGLDGVKDAFARQRQLHAVLAAPVDVAAVASALPGAQVSAGQPDAGQRDGATAGPAGLAREVSITFDRFELAAGRVIGVLSGLAEVVDLSIDEPAIEDVVRKVYAGELELAP